MSDFTTMPEELKDPAVRKEIERQAAVNFQQQVAQAKKTLAGEAPKGELVHLMSNLPFSTHIPDMSGGANGVEIGGLLSENGPFAKISQEQMDEVVAFSGVLEPYIDEDGKAKEPKVKQIDKQEYLKEFAEFRKLAHTREGRMNSMNNYEREDSEYDIKKVRKSVPRIRMS